MQARSTGEPELLQAQRRRREQREADRANGSSPRRARRRRQSTPWLQRNALSVVAVSVLIAFLGLGFGLLQMLNHPEGSGALSAGQSDGPATAGTASVLQAAALGAAVPVPPDSSAQGRRAIHASAKVIEPNYTVASGDTLVRIADRFNTTVDRILAFNNLADPRVLRIGTKLVIPAPLGS
jgi:nucleoid-associated protein YgaU